MFDTPNRVINTLYSIKENLEPNEEEVRYLIDYLDNTIQDVTCLREIACILSGEYLDSNTYILSKILEYWNWDIKESTNIFISWYYTLCGNTTYYKEMKHRYHTCKLYAFIKMLLVTVICYMVPILFYMMFYYFNPDVLININSVLISFIHYLLLILSIIVIIILSNKGDYYLVFKLSIGFKKYII